MKPVKLLLKNCMNIGSEGCGRKLSIHLLFDREL